MDHYHCPAGCEKTVFERKDDGEPTCVRCGARWVQCDDTICHVRGGDDER
jgi:transcription initiation factor IIE alpha subunit